VIPRQNNKVPRPCPGRKRFPDVQNTGAQFAKYCIGGTLDMNTIFKATAGMAVGAALMLIAPLAEASETGLDIIHVLRREHGHICMADHVHYGNGAGQTKKIALGRAVHSWVLLTDVEYGTSWGRFGKSGNRTIKCEQGDSGWNCEVSGRPCK
jgi:hypothetical protein